MTLTDIMPTLRMSIPDPIDLRQWPPGTSVTIDDVAVQGFSLSTASALLGSPMRWAADDRATTIVVVCSVSAVLPDPTHPILLLDCDVRRGVPTETDASVIDIVWDHARLIGRVSVAHKHRVHLLGDGTHSPLAPAPHAADTDTASVTAPLPRDLVVGDRIAVPCTVGATPVRTSVAGVVAHTARAV
ncbi:hypothetical protein ACQ7HM_06045 [Williamsia sp. MIQD14]|uniref:hypothetical protein n=1 Tax=Williamsia sp. MIQD14 TaxID=3425703 RepID=UPI003D9FF951